ncbi:DUF2993 domain-containing protein [Alkalinema sp. FACHB-956]|uniref:LmeA family phospholipid-binding protein n=1 Tax=Alkalinema sp. FACHB-956 TaxID=2692768 RepID=UPI0016853D2D|nr:DUF2993 domain-containing protein [Alkalinema sp. FACHB-956]MBD2327164.1 DUF2993 domain-containing protein [Alkalinema sp. FACHB-956]
MEPFTIVLSILLGLVSPVGVVGDRLAAQQIRKQFKQVEQLEVRIDNAPNHQILQGKVNKVRLAGRGLFPIEGLRLDTLEVETDPIVLKGLKTQLAKPLQAGVYLFLTEADLNRALQSPTVTDRIKNLSFRFLQPEEADQVARYDLVNPQVDFLPNSRVRLQTELTEQGYPDRLAIVAETKLQVIAGKKLQLTQMTLTLNGQPAPKAVVEAIAQGISQRLDLQRLEQSNTTARILQLQTDDRGLGLTTFVQVRPR